MLTIWSFPNIIYAFRVLVNSEITRNLIFEVYFSYFKHFLCDLVTIISDVKEMQQFFCCLLVSLIHICLHGSTVNVSHAALPEHFIRNISHFSIDNLLISPCFPTKHMWSEFAFFFPSCLWVIAPAQIGVIYACFWNNQSCLSRALEPPGSESFCNEFWFAKSPSNLFSQFSANIKTNSPFLCHKLLDLGEGEQGRGLGKGGFAGMKHPRFVY